MKQVEEKIWLVSFMRYDLGFFDHETDRVTSVENPFGASVTYVPGIVRYLCDRNEPRDLMVARGGIEPPTRGFSDRTRWF